MFCRDVTKNFYLNTLQIICEGRYNQVSEKQLKTFETKYMVLLAVFINCCLYFKLHLRRWGIKKHEEAQQLNQSPFKLKPNDLEGVLINITISIIMALTTGNFSKVNAVFIQIEAELLW